MAKRIIIVIIALAILFGLVFGFHAFRSVMIGKYVKQMLSSPVTISTVTAQTEDWHPGLRAVGNLTAVNGIDVNSEVPGQIINIYYKSGQNVKKDDLLIQLDDSLDQQNLKTQETQLNFVQSDYNRKKTLAARNVISQSDLDVASNNLHQAQSAVAAAKLSISFKKIKAPFTGRLGISQVSIGQYITPGLPLVPIQQMDPLYVDFTLPEQQLRYLSANQSVEVTVDAYPQRVFTGKITAINSRSDPTTHTISVRATIPNPETLLYPGIFAVVNVVLPSQQNVVTLPQTAIAYSLHGDSVYVVTDTGKKDEQGKPILVAEQRFVKVGERKGNNVAILEGVKPGEQVVNAGQLKLQPGMRVNVNNSVQLK